ncbi:MAG: anthranilate synthase component I family protein [Myxococcales bacterium]|nr:anthranilate synthase component I family protein [Myxococcales bacterium]MCB9577242.1 anthranilate synthase component I family protein [Polyangiaceae bacterium]
MFARVLDVAPDPLRLCRALGDRPGIALLWSATGGASYLGAEPLAEAGALDPEPSLAIAPLEQDFGHVPRWVGVLPYEARRSLERRGDAATDPRPAPHVSSVRWCRYGAMAEIDDRGVRVVGDDAASVARLAAALDGPPRAVASHIDLLGPTEPARRHEERIRAALELIAKGELYQVNLARRFRFRVQGHPLGQLERMSRRARAPYAAWLRLGELDVVSTTPELLLRLSPDRRLLTSPIKGTRPRGADAQRDRALAVELEGDPKERAELAMIIDVERNDLGRVAVSGSVRLLGPPRVVTHPSVHHRVAHVSARLRPELGRRELLEAMLPSGSVTGAPKIRAMDAIRALEAERRGLYTGGFGVVRHDGGMELGMAIRTLTVVDGEGHYFAGGGIVADSDPAREVEETLWKSVQLLGSGERGQKLV